MEMKRKHESEQIQALNDIEASFRSAIRQALVLNPNMNLRGISLFHFVEEGKLMASENGVKRILDSNDPSLMAFDPSSPVNEDGEKEADTFISRPEA